MFYLKKLLTALVMPPFGLLLLVLAGILLSRRHPRTGRGLAIGALAALFALCFDPVADALLHSLETQPVISAANLKEAQAIVVLGGGMYPEAPEYGGDAIGRWSLERVRYGARLQKLTGLPMLVSGGSPFGGTPEAHTMRVVVEEDLHGSVKWAEDASRDTAENAAFSAKLLKADGVTRIALVTHAWHLKRATGWFEREGLQVFPAPTAFTTSLPFGFDTLLPSAEALRKSSFALKEWLGIFVARLTG